MATAAIAVSVRGSRLGCGLLGVTFGGLTAFALAPRSVPPTTYAAASALAGVVGLAAGFGLLAAGVATSFVRPRGSDAIVTTLLGVAWLANDWVGWENGPTLARSLAMIAVLLLVPLVTHLTLVYPSGRYRGATAVALTAVYGATVVTSVGYAMFRDPFRDLACWSNCSVNSFLVRADADLVHVLDGIWLTTVTGAAVITAAAVAIRLARSTSVARRSTRFVLAAGAVVSVGNAVQAWLVHQRTEDPTVALFRAVYVLRASALLAVAAGVGWGLWRVDHTRRSVTRLADQLGATPAPGSLGPALARLLGDAGLTVGYWLPSSQRYVDAAGEQVEPRPGRDQVAAAIVRKGEPVALVMHDAALAPQGAIGAAARLAVDNERLRAEVLARLADLRSSRARIAATADATRRRIERDLHDGAQQRLLAASFELRQARAAAQADRDMGLAARLAIASEQAQDALSELRDLAHGIYPAILTEAGLDPALRSLAARAPVPVEVGEVVTGRFAAAVESTAYTVVAESIDAAAEGSATFVSMRILGNGDRLVVLVDTDGVGPARELVVDLADRVGALGGTIEVLGGTLQAEIPCVS